ncbi:MAG: hypothetical protein RIS25_772 [Actinomycetota bacterium]|jgi:oligoribonuclease
MSAADDRIVWIDCEMTGLNPDIDEIVEVAVIVTNYDLEPLDPGFQVVIKPSSAALEQMNDFVTNMHTVSGLITEIDNGVSITEAQTQILEYIQRFVAQPRTAVVGGNSIGTDRTFINRYLPEVDAFLHYRSIDVSSIKELSRRWFPRAYFHSPEKNGGHRALADILESIRELDYYRSAVFLDGIGPTSDQAKAHAAASVEKWSGKL